MAKQRRRKSPPPVLFRPQVVGAILVIVALLTLLSLLSFSQGVVTRGWLHLLRQAFGWAVYLAPAGLGAAGLWALLQGMDRPPAVPWGRIGGAVMLVGLLLAMTHLFIPVAQREAVARSGGGGGYTGWAIGSLLVSMVGEWGSYVILAVLGGAASCLLLRLPPGEVATALGQLRERWRQGRELREERTPSPQPPTIASPRRSAAAPATPPPSPRRSSETSVPHPRIIGGAGPWILPPIAEIFSDSPEPEISQGDIRRLARIIEETLAHFGVPARVMEVNQGPAITQFGVEPGFITRQSGKRQKVKVSQINALSDDLALALAASPIRIEAPIPGRPLVGIEVPNARSALVSLRGVMESEEFRKLDAPLKFALGRDVSGAAMVADLAAMPHLLIAGATGSGKSACINAIIACLLCGHTPDRLKFLMVDPKMVELSLYNGIPHLLAPVIVQLDGVVDSLKWVTHQMDERYRRFSEVGARHLNDHNRRMASRGEKELPYIVVVIDELADLMMMAPDEVERQVCRIAQMARATGIHLIIATQRPSVDVVTGLIKANFPARIAFATVSQVDSRVVLDTVGAEQLLGRGDMLYMAPDSAKLVRIQGCFASDGELRALVSYWKEAHVPATSPEVAAQLPLALSPEPAEEEDDLLGEAIQLVRQHRRASVAFLQRRLRVGLPRATRLMALLEERGVIGSSQEVLPEEPARDLP